MIWDSTVLDVYSGGGYYGDSTEAVATVCPRCGLLVGETWTHEEWHAKINDPIA